MPPLTQEVRNLFQGVSTLPQHQRSSANVNEQLNSAVYQGRMLGTRPPTYHMAQLDDSPSGDASIIFITRSATEKYIAVILNGEVKVYDAFDGEEITVYAPEGYDYINQTTLGYRSLTVEDRTFIVNRLMTVSRGFTSAPIGTRWDSLVVVRQGNFGTRYSIRVGDTTVSYTTPASLASGSEEDISTDAIATELETLLDAAPALDADYVFTRYGSTIHIQYTPGGYNHVSTTDGLGNDGMSVIHGAVHRFEDLPTQAPDEYLIEVRGDETSAFDNFWVEYDLDKSTWVERVAPGAVKSFDAATMPHLLEYKGSFLDETAHQGAVATESFTNDTLSLVANSLVGKKVRNKTDGSQATVTANNATTVFCTALTGGARNTFEDGDIVDVIGYDKYFIFKPAPWTARSAGDDRTNPFPSLVGKTIKDLFVSQGRLCFLTDYSIVGSQSRKIFNLFRPTVTQVLDDHPFDITESLPSASKFHAAVEWGRKPVIWTDQAQYELVGEPILSPKTVSIRRISSFQNSPLVRPVSDGSRMFYIGLSNGLSRVMELRDSNQDSDPYAQPLNEHALTYIRGLPSRLAVDETNGLLLLVTRDGTRHRLYACSYVIQDGDIVQSSWGEWVLHLQSDEYIPIILS